MSDTGTHRYGNCSVVKIIKVYTICKEMSSCEIFGLQYVYVLQPLLSKEKNTTGIELSAKTYASVSFVWQQFRND